MQERFTSLQIGNHITIYGKPYVVLGSIYVQGTRHENVRKLRNQESTNIVRKKEGRLEYIDWIIQEQKTHKQYYLSESVSWHYEKPTYELTMTSVQPAPHIHVSNVEDACIDLSIYDIQETLPPKAKDEVRIVDIQGVSLDNAIGDRYVTYYVRSSTRDGMYCIDVEQGQYTGFIEKILDPQQIRLIDTPADQDIPFPNSISIIKDSIEEKKDTNVGGLILAILIAIWIIYTLLHSSCTPQEQNSAREGSTPTTTDTSNNCISRGGTRGQGMK